MTTVRIQKSGAFEVVVEVKPIFGTTRDVASRIKRLSVTAGSSVDVVNNEVIVRIPT